MTFLLITMQRDSGSLPVMRRHKATKRSVARPAVGVGMGYGVWIMGYATSVPISRRMQARSEHALCVSVPVTNADTSARRFSPSPLYRNVYHLRPCAQPPAPRAATTLLLHLHPMHKVHFMHPHVTPSARTASCGQLPSSSTLP